MLQIGFAVWYDKDNCGAGTQGGFKIKLAIDDPRALVHTLQAYAGHRCFRVIVETVAVIGDGHLELLGRIAELDVEVGGIGML